MRAILLENFGAAESLNVREVPTPAPGNGEVLVEIRAAAINPSFVKNVEGKMHGTTLPRGLGEIHFYRGGRRGTQRKLRIVKCEW